MNSIVNIGIIGDYDGRPSHIATEEAVKHCAEALGFDVKVQWISTDLLNDGTTDVLSCYDGIWCAPGSPYKSMIGAVNAIQYARENDIPFIGTCGGFQHTAIEAARNILKLDSVLNEEFDPYAPNEIITPLACSLIKQERQIQINEKSVISRIYGTTEISEKYNCSFGLKKEFQNQLEQVGYQIAGTDEAGETRILVYNKNRFFVATLFQPQLSSSKEKLHPLILAFLSAVYVGIVKR